VTSLTTTSLGDQKVTSQPSHEPLGSSISERDHPCTSNHTLFHVIEIKPQVGSDWLMSSPKLQPCLELCRFTQALLKTKVTIWKAHSLSELAKDHVHHSSEQMAYYSRYKTGKKNVTLGVSLLQ
jgi:hypothetical protein